MAHAMLDRFRAAQVIPVVRTRSAKTAGIAVAWLRDAGLRIFEITMTVPDATALIRDLAADPALLVGAGTVPDAATAEACLKAERNSSSRPGSIPRWPHPAAPPEPPPCWVR
jgi:2-dehydro-3-deoxyphosphogluconate aldolase/(4S)-4-hydroxy-2-oxoglutarate aldolase